MNRYNDRNRLVIILAIALLAIGLMLTFMYSPIEAQNASQWNAQFYNNGTISGTPVHQEGTQFVAYNWGTGAPSANLPTDGFSMTMTSQVNFDNATYRFYLRADDGATVAIDGNVIINTYQNTRPDDLIMTDVPITAGVHEIRIDYLDIVGPAFIYFTWENVATATDTPNFAVGPNTGSVSTPIQSNGQWTAEYFTNRDLQGLPSAIVNEAGPSHNWRSSAPLQGLPANNFSVRWTSSPNLTAGTYQIDVQADDGLRVFVDGVPYINEWHSASGENYVVTVALTGGTHTFVVEYYEATGLAAINFTLTGVDDAVVGNPVSPTAPQLTVATSGANLNVRNAPDIETGDILFRISRGQTFPVIGRNADSSWWQINVNGRTGWVSGQFVNTANIATVPVTNDAVLPTPDLSGYEVRTIANLNMRADPTLDSSIVSVIPFLRTADVVGRNTEATWLRVHFDGITGWISARYVNLINAQSIADIPVVFD